MTHPSRPREQLFERDLAIILSCDKGTARAAFPARGRQLWLVPLIIAAFGGFTDLHLHNQAEPVEAPTASNSAPTAPSRPLARAEARTEHPAPLASPIVAAPTVRAPVAVRSREIRRPRRAAGHEMVSYQKSPASILPTNGERSNGEKATTNAPDMETQSARDERQRLARLEAIDAVRALRLH